MIKTIIFDLGGVIIDHGNQIDYFVKIFKPKDKKEFWNKINHYAGPLCEGKISEKEYWIKIAESYNIDPVSIPENLWSKNYGDSTSVNNNVIQLIKKLKNKYKLIMISNTIKSHVEINKSRGIFEYFDDVILSNEVKLSKANLDIFYLALKRNSLKPEECIYIDDIKKFVDSADSIGLNGIQYLNYEQLKKELISFSVIVE